MRIRVLAFEGCPNDQATIRLIREVLSSRGIPATVERIEVAPESCVSLRFLGSPTVQINDVDIEPAARASTQFAMSCRCYGGRSGVPSRQLIEDALAESIGDPG